MAQPHPSRLFQPAKRPCWHCGTRHESNTIPALCSDPCRAAWRNLYELQYGVSPVLDEQELSVLQQLGTTVAEATAGLDALKAAVHAEQQLMHTEGTIRQWSERHRAVPQSAFVSVLHDPDWRPADDPQDLLDGNRDMCPPRPPEPPAARLPLVDPRGMVQARQPWWRRWLRRG